MGKLKEHTVVSEIFAESILGTISNIFSSIFDLGPFLL